MYKLTFPSFSSAASYYKSNILAKNEERSYFEIISLKVFGFQILSDGVYLQKYNYTS